MCQPRMLEDRVYFHFLVAAEHDLCAFAMDVDGV
jgi:hypothetical protein